MTSAFEMPSPPSPRRAGGALDDDDALAVETRSKASRMRALKATPVRITAVAPSI